MNIRRPSVAGLFYPASATALHREIETFLDAAGEPPPRQPKAIVSPHAGYVYSGPVAAYGYGAVKPFADRIRRVVLLAPAHRLPFEGLAVPSVDAFRTPLGDIPVDVAGVAAALAQPGVRTLDRAFDDEHAIEVQLPFLQEALGEISLVPLVVGVAADEEVAGVIRALWGGDETLVVISSDLSHYLDYESARTRDLATRGAIEGMEPAQLTGHDACGYLPLRGLLTVAREKGLRVETLDMRNSGDTAGPRDRVVGYGSYAVYE
jgi:AmmeMemoRadiSam system protein B